MYIYIYINAYNIFLHKYTNINTPQTQRHRGLSFFLL